MADGYINNKRKYNGYKLGCSLAEEDKPHLEKLKDALSYTGEITGPYTTKTGYSKETTYYRLLVSDSKLCEDLITKGCGLSKTFNTAYPSKEVLPEEYDRDFIRGLIDGDGSVIITNLNKDKKKDFEIGFTGTQEMCEAIMMKLVGKKLSLQKRNPERENNNYSFMIGGNNQVLQICDYLYKDATVYLDRKYKKYEQMVEISRA